MVSCLFVLLIACSIAHGVLGNANTQQTKLSSAKTYKQYAILDLPGQTPTVKVATKAKASPTSRPVAEPTGSPIAVPTVSPTAKAKASPTARPVAEPTDSPIAVPTDAPIAEPTVSPTPKAKASPTARPVGEPTANPIADPTTAPTFVPTEQPIAEPTANPVVDPTIAPTFLPSEQPIPEPTANPVVDPTVAPSFSPTEKPIAVPTEMPIPVPTFVPTVMLTVVPSALPTTAPNRVPTRKPSLKPTLRPTTWWQRHPICRVSQLFFGVTIYLYQQNPDGCNNVILAAIVASVQGINSGNIVDPEAFRYPRDQPSDERVSALESAPQGVTLEYTIAVDPDSPLTYEDVALQLTESINSHHFTDLMHQIAREQNVTQMMVATSPSVETLDDSALDTSARGSSDALKDDAVVGIAVGLCAALLLAAYFARLYVLRRAASSSRSDSVEMTAGKSPLSAGVEEGWTDNPLSAYSSHDANPTASQGVSSVVAVPVSSSATAGAEAYVGSEA